MTTRRDCSNHQSHSNDNIKNSSKANTVVTLKNISLSKPSLRQRLEEYYKLVAPEKVLGANIHHQQQKDTWNGVSNNDTSNRNSTKDENDSNEWRERFEEIWSKYGGTYQGEMKLAKKLQQKYGTTVRFVTATEPQKSTNHKNKQQKTSYFLTESGSVKNTTGITTIATAGGDGDCYDHNHEFDISNDDKEEKRKKQQAQRKVIVNDEKWYQLNELEQGSHIVDFTSNRFDPCYALKLISITSSKQNTGPTSKSNDKNTVNTPNLNSTATAVEEANPWYAQLLLSSSATGGNPIALLNRVEQFRYYLPQNDPLYLSPPFNNSSGSIVRSINMKENDTNKLNRCDSASYGVVHDIDKNSTMRASTKKKHPSFLSVITGSCFTDSNNDTEKHSTIATNGSFGGPMSFLYNAVSNNIRVRVLIRRFHSKHSSNTNNKPADTASICTTPRVRGILTGYILAFDKHMNLIFQKDSYEVYSTTTTSRNKCNSNITIHEEPSKHNSISQNSKTLPQLTNTELEVRRRRIYDDDVCKQNNNKTQQTNHSTDSVASPTMLIKNSNNRYRRIDGPILVRGDNIILLYQADSERSAWPKTSKSPKQSLYYPSLSSSTSSTTASAATTTNGTFRVGTPGSMLLAYNSSIQQPHKKRSYESTIGLEAIAKSCNRNQKRDFSSHS